MSVCGATFTAYCGRRLLQCRLNDKTTAAIEIYSSFMFLICLPPIYALVLETTNSIWRITQIYLPEN